MNAKKKETPVELNPGEQNEQNLLDILKGDVASTAETREAERRARIDEENRAYAAAIDETFQLIIKAGGKGPEDLSDAVATKLFRDKLRSFKFPAFEEVLKDGPPRLRPAGDRLDGLRTVEGDNSMYLASSVAWRIAKILKMLRAKTDIPRFSWESGPTRNPVRYVDVEEKPETLADVAEIKPAKKPARGRPTKAAKKLADAKAKQGGKS